MLTLNQVRAQIAAIHRRTPDSPVLGLYSPTRWRGEDRIDVDGSTFWLRGADTELEMRAILSEPRPDGVGMVVLTDLDAAQIGEDLLARFARRRFHSLSAAEILKELFQAKDVDPRLQHAKWMANALADARPDGGYLPAAQGLLDQETAWRAFLDRRLRLDSARPDLQTLVVWAHKPGNADRWRALDEESRAAAQRWIASSAGPVSVWVTAAMQQQPGESIVALGVVASVLFGSSDVPIEIATARGKFERYFGDTHLAPEEGRTFADAAQLWIESPGLASEAVRVEIERADALLQQLRVEDYAIRSDVSLIGFERRLRVSGESLSTFLKRPSADGLDGLCRTRDEVRRHRCARLDVERVERVEMATRLARYLLLASGRPVDGGFSELARRYVQDDSFVDTARYVLFHGDSVPELNQAYAELVSKIEEIREGVNQRFGASLAEWTTSGTTSRDLLLIEDVLAARVAAIAKQRPVALVVLDGMSFPVYRQLVAGLVADGWAEAIPSDCSGSVPAVAGLPTITEWSRRLLLSGRNDVKSGEDELAAFRDAPALVGVARSGQPPTLFRKGELTGPSERSLSEDVRREIASSRRQIVGVVINAVDDHLMKDDQLYVSWTLARIPLLEQVFDVAREAERVVILTSDHGHVLSHHSRLLRSGSSDRFRSPDGTVAMEEIHLSKGRAAMNGKGGFVAPWSERVYYTTRRNGFHGGITPQEALVPATVLVSGGAAPDGWRLIPQVTPSWWWDTSAQPIGVELVPAKPVAKKPKKADPGLETLPLFAAEQTSAASWIDTLFASAVFADQYTKAGRTPPGRETIRRVLSALDDRNGTLLKSALAQRTGEPEFRINGLLAVLRRILNVDGYAVLGVDEASDTVRLDRDLLRKQFDLQK